MALPLAREEPKQHARQNGEDGYDHQQFDQGKPGGSRSDWTPSFTI